MHPVNLTHEDPQGQGQGFLGALRVQIRHPGGCFAMAHLSAMSDSAKTRSKVRRAMPDSIPWMVGGKATGTQETTDPSDRNNFQLAQ
ncbi:hypothetical protein FG05_30068 [Fusarium graminearum]|nr:hypothetical protein FG05_30068 [Fusarium graminearum]